MRCQTKSWHASSTTGTTVKPEWGMSSSDETGPLAGADSFERCPSTTHTSVWIYTHEEDQINAFKARQSVTASQS